MFLPPWTELHGALTHFPIALLFTAVAFSVGAKVFNKEEWRVVSFWLQIGAAVMAIPSLVAGMQAGEQLFGQASHPPAILAHHRMAAFAACALTWISLGCRAAAKYRPKWQLSAAPIFVSLIAAGIMGYAGFLGGQMVFGGSNVVQADSSPPTANQVTNSDSKVRPKPPLDPTLVKTGRAIFDKNGCLACHSLNGKGSSTGPRLDGEGIRHPELDWQIRHLAAPAELSKGSTMPAYDKLKTSDAKALATFLLSL